MRRRTISLTVTIAALAVGLLNIMATAALGQTGYPPGPQAPVVSQTLPPAPGPVVVEFRRGFAFTGADIIPWVLAALAMVAVGTLLVVANRRRARVAI